MKDEAQLLTTLAYIDLNPFAAGLCDRPETAQHTSLAARLQGQDQSPTQDFSQHVVADQTSTTPHATPAEKHGWWMSLGGGEPGASQSHRAVLPGTTLTLHHYLLLIDRVAKLMRKSKRALAQDAAPILRRIAVSPRGLASTLDDWYEKGLPWERAAAGT